MRNIPPYNPQHPVTVVTGNTTLTSRDRYVFADNPGTSVTITLTTTPPDGTRHSITQGNASYGLVTVNSGGSDVIIASGTTSVVLGGYGASLDFLYVAAQARWVITNLQRNTFTFKWNSASTNDYLQQGVVSVLGGTLTYAGGALSTALPIVGQVGLIVVGHLRLQTRSVVGANTTVKVRSANVAFSSATDLSPSLSATILSGAQGGVGSARNVIGATSIASSPIPQFVLQATTAIGTPIDGQLEYWTA